MTDIVWETVTYNGKRIRLTEAQMRHTAVFHPESMEHEQLLKETVTMPSVVAAGGSANVRILYRFYQRTAVNRKYLAVVIRELDDEGFILTSYFTDRIRRKIIWKRAS